MRIVLAPVGTPSDVIPMFGLAQELHKRGHPVTFCAPEQYRSQVMKLGYQMVSCGRSFHEYVETGEGTKDRSADLVEVVREELAVQFVSLRDALREADLLIGGMLLTAGPSMAEKVQIPYAYYVNSPLLLDADQFPAFAMSHKKYRGILGGARKNSLRAKWDTQVKTALNKEREYTGLKPIDDIHAHVFRSGKLLLGFDREVTPYPASGEMIQTGFWFYENQNDPDPELGQFLNAGTPPIYIDAFLKGKNAGRVIDAMVKAFIASGQRVLVSSEWGVEASSLPKTARLVDPDLLESLFGHIDAIVHRGNAFLTSSVLRAGLPQIIVPLLFDQYYWAERIKQLGVGNYSSDATNGDALVHMVRKTIFDTTLREKAKSIAARLSKTNGVVVAADELEKVFVQSPVNS